MKRTRSCCISNKISDVLKYVKNTVDDVCNSIDDLKSVLGVMDYMDQYRRITGTSFGEQADAYRRHLEELLGDAGKK